MGVNRRAPSKVRSRIDSDGGHHGARGRLLGSNGGGWLETLKAKAGRNCYNCLSRGHCIADCRDPPRCLLCFRFGHKAARCYSPPPHASARRPALRSAAAAPVAPVSAAPRPAPTTAAASAAPHPAPAAAATQGAAAVSAVEQAAAAAAVPRPTQGASAVAAAADVAAASHRRAGGSAAWSTMEEDYALYHRIREERPSHVLAGARRTEAIREEEQAMVDFALLAVQVDARVRLESERVRAEAVRQFHVPPYDLGVRRLSAASFLLHFDGQHQRDSARRLGALRVGPVRLQLLPWMRQVGARAELSQFFYHVRLCIEGVPVHARRPETIASLLPKPSFVDDLDCDVEKPEEEECYCLWIWTSVPAAIATAGMLQIEEPVVLPQAGYAEGLMELGMPMGALRIEPAKTLDYDVLIHVDHVLDYSPQPLRSSQRSPESPISGHSEDQPDRQWPLSIPFPWRLGVQDGLTQRPELGRVSVHDRLGGRGRDRSPPRGGGSSGLGLRQVPPSGPHDLGAGFGGGRGFHQGSCSRHGGRHGGGQHRRRALQDDGSAWHWRPKSNSGQGGRRDAGFVAGMHGKPQAQVWRPRQNQNGNRVVQQFSSVADDSFLIGEREALMQRCVDPMEEEATWSSRPIPRQSAGLQRSVEPTAPNADLVRTDLLDGVHDLVGRLVEGRVHTTTGQEDLIGQEDQNTVAQDTVLLGTKQVATTESALRDAKHAGLTTGMDGFCGEHSAACDGKGASDDPAAAKTDAEHAGVVPLLRDQVTVLDMAAPSLPRDETQETAGEALITPEVYLVGDGQLLEPGAILGPNGSRGPAGYDEMIGRMIEEGAQADGLHGQMDGPAAAVTATRPMFDLNVQCNYPAEELQVQETSDAVEDMRQVLGQAEGRLNKESGGHKSFPRGMARYTIPLRKSLLCIPPARAKVQVPKKQVDADTVKTDKRGFKGKVKFGLSVDDQATVFLLKTCGIGHDAEEPNDEAQQQLGEKLACPLQENVVTNVRVAFGLPEVGGFDLLTPLLSEVNDAYDA
ncbi:unnamed protein product [Urochloa decumbens]|uniref:CCHC-type domain-containing protein n=1 Tax=Urochloa decumbens TaxID=240449 RepID=A0ABC8Y032_9POAL